LSGLLKRAINKWSDTIFGKEKDRNQGSIKVINRKDKTVVFAAASGDKSFWFSGMKKTGQKKVAQRLADKLKDYFKSVKT
jgi:abortive infection bacteriophage resistance protein